MRSEAKITSRNQITIPPEVRRRLGVKSGDRLIFEYDGQKICVKPVKTSSIWDKWQGIGNPGIPSGKRALLKHFRALRGR
jgi:AbrB family looped-hinge helix DNA binding protein